MSFVASTFASVMSRVAVYELCAHVTRSKSIDVLMQLPRPLMPDV